jgi:hypothetical protein
MFTIHFDFFGFQWTQMANQFYSREPKDKKLSQVSTKFPPRLYERLQRACAIQEHHEGQLVRILVEWALPHYERSRSVEELYETEVFHRPKQKKPRDKKP